MVIITNKWSGEKFHIDMDSNSLNDADYQYHKLVEKILEEGIWKENRTGIKTLSIFGPQVEFKNIGEKFPLLTTKRIHLKSIIGELLWFLSGSTNKHELKDKYGVTIWDEWGDDETGELGPIYGHQWVHWEYYKKNPDWTPDGKPRISDTPKNNKDKFIKDYENQILDILHKLHTNPDDRRMIVSAWNVPQIPKMALPPCHWSYQFDTRQYPGDDKRTLNIKMNIRSWDIFLGGPFNIASYAILLLMMAQEVNMIPGNLYISAGDVHIYENHLEYILKQLARSSKTHEPIMKLNENKDFWGFKPEDFDLYGYNAHPNWKNIPVAV